MVIKWVSFDFLWRIIGLLGLQAPCHTLYRLVGETKLVEFREKVIRREYIAMFLLVDQHVEALS